MTTTAAQRTAAHAAFIARRETVSALLVKHGADCYGNFKTDVACEAFYNDLAAYDARHHNPCHMVVEHNPCHMVVEHNPCHMVVEHNPTAETLEAMHSPRGDGEHPVHTRWEWLQAVAAGDTITGYWAWAAHQSNA